jgi:RNA polymerase sigma-70 factor (sigma-E family)
MSGTGLVLSEPYSGPEAQRAQRPGRDVSTAESRITALYQSHALGLTRLAHVILGDRAAAEDVVQEAFCGLYRNWARLSDPAAALPYLRTSVLNGSRSVLRRRRLWASKALHEPAAASAESIALITEEQRAVLAALRKLPARQREVLIFRFYLHEADQEIARLMGISPGTVRSTSHRALSALGRLLGESQ